MTKSLIPLSQKWYPNCEWTQGSLLWCIQDKIFNMLLIFINNPHQYMSFTDILKHVVEHNIWDITHNILQCQQVQVIVCSCCWCTLGVNELVSVVIHIATKSKHIIKMFTVHLFPFLSKSLKEHFQEVWACAIQNVANCDMVWNVFLEDNVDYNHSKLWIWNGSDIGSQYD